MNRMKNLLLLGAICLCLASCKKDFECSCNLVVENTSTGEVTSTLSVTELENYKEDDAEEACDAISYPLEPGSNHSNNCTLSQK